MSDVGQNRKTSMRAYVFRSAPNNGHRAITAACPFRATTGLGRCNHLIDFVHGGPSHLICS